MSIINRIFNNTAKTEKSHAEHWEHLDKIDQLNNIEQASHSKPIVIFKHSTRCSISGFALRQFEKDYNIPTENMDLYFLDLLSHRNISNEIAARFGVGHQSPQIVVIKNGKAIYDASHENIHAEDLKQFSE
jgi:monothiol bacilliredoxin